MPNKYVVFVTFPKIKDLLGLTISGKRADELALVETEEPIDNEIVKGEVTLDSLSELNAISFLYTLNVFAYDYDDFQKYLEDPTHVPTRLLIPNEEQEDDSSH